MVQASGRGSWQGTKPTRSSLAFDFSGELEQATTTARQVPAKAEMARLRLTRPPITPHVPCANHCIQLKSAEGADGMMKIRKSHSEPGTSSGWTTE